MQNKLVIILLCCYSLGCVANEAVPAAPSPLTETVEPLLPGGQLQVAPSGEVTVGEAPVTSPEKGRWQQRRIINGTFVFAQQRTRTRMEAAGFTLRHEIPMGRKPHPAVLMLWEKNERQVMVLLRRLELDRTECLEGEVQDGK